MGTPTPVPRIAGLAEVAILADVSRKRAWQLTQLKTFPKPVQVLAMGPVWREADVLAFLMVPRSAGRPSATARRQENDVNR